MYQLQTSVAHLRPLACVGQEARPVIIDTNVSQGMKYMKGIKSKVSESKDKVYTICGLWSGGFVFKITYSIAVAL